MKQRSYLFASPPAAHTNTVTVTHTVVVNMVFVGLTFVFLAFGIDNVASGQGQTISVAVCEFSDDGAIAVSSLGAQKIARDVAQKLNADYKDVLARRLEAATDAPSIKAMTVEQLVSLGKQYGVKFVVRGGLLAAADRDSNRATGALVQLYADIVSVETLSVRTERAEGSGTAKEQALSAAVAQLAESIHRAILSPDSKDVAQTVESAPTVSKDVAQTVESAPTVSKDVAQTVESAPTVSKDVAQTVESAPEEYGAADADQELQQLIAEAESLVADGTTGTADRLASVSQALAALKSALKSKAVLLEEGKDPAPADQEIARHREELQASLSALAESQMPGAADPGDTQEEQQPSGEKKNLLARIGEYASETLNIIQKIQEIRAALRGSSGSQPALITEESTEEISGVVTEMGEPVAGVTVTEPESGGSAQTDINGSYTLPGVAAGRLATLVVAKRGKQIATGKIDLARRGLKIADFEVTPKAAGASQPALRILPSKVFVARARMEDIGVLKGVVRDAQGRPAARALVRLKGLAMARTDSQGRYAFLNVRPGTYQLIVQRAGSKPRTEMVQVASKKSSESRIQFASADSPPNIRKQQSLIVPGAGTVLRGVIVDTQKRPVAGAKITVIQRTTTLSVLAGPRGSYQMRDIKPGSYRVLVSKAGHAPIAQPLAIKAGEVEQRDFQLTKADSPYIERALAARRSNRSSSSRDSGGVDGSQPRNKIGGAREPLNVRRAVGRLRGRIADVKTGRPVPGALVLISGQRAITSDGAGSFACDLTPGAYRVIARKAEFLDGTTSLVVRSGETTTADLRLNPRPLGRAR